MGLSAEAELIYGFLVKENSEEMAKFDQADYPEGIHYSRITEGHCEDIVVGVRVAKADDFGPQPVDFMSFDPKKWQDTLDRSLDYFLSIGINIRKKSPLLYLCASM